MYDIRIPTTLQTDTFLNWYWLSATLDIKCINNDFYVITKNIGCWNIPFEWFRSKSIAMCNLNLKELMISFFFICGGFLFVIITSFISRNEWVNDLGLKLKNLIDPYYTKEIGTGSHKPASSGNKNLAEKSKTTAAIPIPMNQP